MGFSPRVIFASQFFSFFFEETQVNTTAFAVSSGAKYEGFKRVMRDFGGIQRLTSFLVCKGVVKQSTKDLREE